MTQLTTPDLILFNGRFTTLDRSKPTATAASVPSAATAKSCLWPARRRGASIWVGAVRCPD
ncbi:hypothetical protein COAQ111491_05520 [Comamonas aquatilis]